MRLKEITRKIAVVLTVAMVLALFGSAAFAEDTGAIKADIDADKLAEYNEASVVMDVYCLATLEDGQYKMTPAYEELEVDTDMAEDETYAAQVAQEALAMTFAPGSSAVPVNQEGLTLDVAAENIPAGWYMIVLRGSDLDQADFLKTIQDDEGEDTYVTIAKTTDNEYSFLPILMTVDGTEAVTEFVIKGESQPRYGSLRITKTVTRYNSYILEHPVMFVFHVVAVDSDGNTVYDNYTGINYPEQRYVDLYRLPADSIATVTEVYTGSDYKKSSVDPAPVTIQAGETADIVIDEAGNAVNLAEFENDYDDDENHGSGVVNRFEYNGSTWDWYKDGEKQNGVQ